MDRKPVLPPPTTHLTSLAPSPNMGDLRPWIHQIAQEVDSLTKRLHSIEQRIEDVTRQGTANSEQLETLKAELQQVKAALETYAETLGRIIASQSTLETEMKSIKSTVVGSSLDIVHQGDKMATKKAQVWAVVIGAIATAVLNWVAGQL